MKKLDRRTFLQASSLGALSLGLGRLAFTLFPGAPTGAEALAAGEPAAAGAATDAVGRARGQQPYWDWRDIYREKWTWDRVVRGTHTNANCVSSCAWNLYVKDELVWREEQASSYEEGSLDCPDFNPRGCQKGACASALFEGPTRLSYPLERIGERGGGRWKRVSWQQALDKTAEALIDAVEAQGGHGLIAEIGPETGYGPNSAAPTRFFKMLGSPITDSMAMIGDVAFGGTMTLGTPHTDGSSDDWFRSKYLVMWAFNPLSTRIPDAHFLTEARYGGTRVVSIAPDYNPTSIRADMWLNPKQGSDAALALAAVQVIISEGLHDRAYIAEQTDLPLLVRRDNGRFLRESDLREGGNEEVFYAWDPARSREVRAPGGRGSADESLSWGAVSPALEGQWRVRAADGKVLEVETVFSKLKRRLDADYSPEQAAGITGLNPQTIRRFAREFAAADSALILSQYGSCKHYHSDLLQRSQILLASVTGNLGRAGGGWRSGAFVTMEGMAVMSMKKDLGLFDLVLLAAQSYFRDPEDNIAEFSEYFVPSGLWHYVHGGLEAESSRADYGDPMLVDGPGPYVREALEGNWFPVQTEKTPTFLLSVLGNVLRHSRNAGRLREHLWPKLDMVVSIDFRMSQTATQSDIVLPAAGWYEKVGFKYIPSMIPYLTLGDRAVPPSGDSKPEWEIFHLLSSAVARRARERGVGVYSDYLSRERDLKQLDAAYSDDGRFGPGDEEKLVEFVLMVSSCAKGIDLERLRKSGNERLVSLGQVGGTNGIFSDYSSKEPVVPLRWFAEKKQPYPTLTGRQQFYIDHRWFLKLDEALPRYKEPPAAGGDYPLVMSGGHTRWSIHAIWRDHELMLRLQRGEPAVLVGAADARERAVKDYERVRVYNDVSDFTARAKIVPGLPPGLVIVYHAWEPFQFENGRSHQHVAPSPIKVTQLAADYGHLAWSFAHYEPGQVDRDTRVEIARLV